MCKAGKSSPDAKEQQRIVNRELFGFVSALFSDVFTILGSGARFSRLLRTNKANVMVSFVIRSR